MVLLLAVLAGLVAGFLRARRGGRQLSTIKLRSTWLVVVGFALQFFAIFFPATQETVPIEIIAAFLISSLVLLLVFAWLNKSQPGFWFLGIGLLLNLIVIAINGGLMPISPETILRLQPKANVESLQYGQRLGASKDILLKTLETQLWQLSDRFTTPIWSPVRVAFSFGDLLIAIGAFLFFWSLGKPIETKSLVHQGE